MGNRSIKDLRLPYELGGLFYPENLSHIYGGLSKEMLDSLHGYSHLRGEGREAELTREGVGGGSYSPIIGAKFTILKGTDFGAVLVRYYNI